MSGTRGIWVLGGREVLITNFTIQNNNWMDISVTRVVTGAVVTMGKGVDLSVGIENQGPYGLLFTQVDFGRGGWVRSV